MPRLAPLIAERIDGRRTRAAIQADLQTLDGSLEADEFDRQFREFFRALNGIGRLFLRVSR